MLSILSNTLPCTAHAHIQELVCACVADVCVCVCVSLIFLAVPACVPAFALSVVFEKNTRTRARECACVCVTGALLDSALFQCNCISDDCPPITNIQKTYARVSSVADSACACKYVEFPIQTNAHARTKSTHNWCGAVTQERHAPHSIADLHHGIIPTTRRRRLPPKQTHTHDHTNSHPRLTNLPAVLSHHLSSPFTPTDCAVVSTVRRNLNRPAECR